MLFLNEQMGKILSLDKVSTKDIGTCGAKAAVLGELKKYFDVPPGFVVTTPAYWDFIQKTNLEESVRGCLSAKNFEKGGGVLRGLQDLILAGNFERGLVDEILRAFDKLEVRSVAVRSSAVFEDSKRASFAGQLYTCLNVKKGNLLFSIKKCFASLFNPSVFMYQKTTNPAFGDFALAVLIQEMVYPDVSGVTFTANPITGDQDSMLIEAVLGLGEALVSGRVNPDQYLVSKDNLGISYSTVSKQMGILKGFEGKSKMRKINRKLGGGSKLTKPQILELAKQCLEIEKYFGFPQDIEWSFSNGRPFILQSRPITTLKG